MNLLLSQGLFWLGALVCLTPYVNSPIALIIGFLLSTFGLVPTQVPVTKITKKLLSYSIIGLGFGIQLSQAYAVTAHGIGLIVTTISCTLIFGWIITSFIGLRRKVGYLISIGTAICGGSAIAAVAPAIKADDDQTGLALATVFVLNSIALFVFPVIGHMLGMDQTTFGMWAAVAIHDTSSVVGAASAYGEHALITATTLKLSRALWIIPVTLLSAIIFRNESKKITIPYFIFFYCAAILLNDMTPQFASYYHVIFAIAKKTLVLSLFLIGCGIRIDTLKKSGLKPLLFGVGLWLTISVSTASWLLLG